MHTTTAIQFALRPLAALILVVLAAPAAAQLVGNAAAGQTRFTRPANTSTGHYCSDCHVEVANRRIKIWGNANADGTASVALERLNAAIGNSNTGMGPLFSSLTEQQRADLAAYIADTPKVNATGLTDANELAFVAPAMGSSVPKTLTINQSATTTENLRVVSIALTSASTRFALTGTGNCVSTSASIAPRGSCSFSVTYTQPTGVSTAEDRMLRITLAMSGSPTDTFTRNVALSGSLLGATPAPTPPASAPPSSGGGAIGWLWQLGLGLGTAALMLRRRLGARA